MSSINTLQNLRQELTESGISFPIYLDYQSTAPMDPRVLDEMMPYFTTKFGNPHSRTHIFGWETETAVEAARKQIASLIGADSKEIIFTSGATESNNLAIRGLADFHRNSNSKKKHIITLSTEHKCVINCCRQLQEEGFKVTYLPVKSNGLLDLNELEKSINDETFLVSIMAIHNEIGVIQPLEEIGKICKSKGVMFHSDIAQAFGKIELDVNQLNMDMASISAHKIYGPKGVGALYVRRKPRVRLSPLINGGGQERGIRSGTLAPALIIGLGKAAELAQNEMQTNYIHVKKLSDYFLNEITTRLPEVYLNGDPIHRYPGNLNLSFAHVEGESLILGIKDLAVSSGSACTSASLEPSYVLHALGIDEDLAHTSLRFGFGKFTKFEEIKYATEIVISEVVRLRDISPLWEMFQEGIDLKSIKWTGH